MILNKNQQVTRGIKNCRFSRLFKGCSPLQPLCNLIGNRPQSATFHTATVVCHAKKGEHTNSTFGFFPAQKPTQKNQKSYF